MISYCDIEEKANLFAASVKLQTASTGLKKIIEGTSLENYEREDVGWVGDLIGEVNWDSSTYKSGKRKKDVYFLLTTMKIRPLFYRSFIEMEFPPSRDFLDRLYETLQSFGGDMRLNREELKIAQQLTHRMAEGVFSYLSCHIGHM